MIWMFLAWVVATDASAQSSSLREWERVARLEAAAASSDRAYLIVRIASSTAELRMRGVTLETHALGSIELGLLRGNSGADEALGQLFKCNAPPPPPPKEILPGVTQPEAESASEEPGVGIVSLTCEPGLVVRLVPRSQQGSLRDRLGEVRWRDEAASPRVRIVIEDSDLSSLVAALPAECLLLFDRSPSPSPDPS